MNIRYFIDKGFNALINDKEAEALTYFKRALKIDKRNSYILSNIAYTLQRMDRFDEAIAMHYKAIMCYNPNRGELLYFLYQNLADTLFEAGRISEGIKFYELALEDVLRYSPIDYDAIDFLWGCCINVLYSKGHLKEVLYLLDLTLKIDYSRDEDLDLEAQMKELRGKILRELAEGIIEN